MTAMTNTVIARVLRRACVMTLAASLSLAACSDTRGVSAEQDWLGYGGTYGEQHFSPLDQINQSTVGNLGLVWSLDLDTSNSSTIPIEVGGTLYFVTGFSVVHAVETVTGKELWRFDPQAARVAGINLRLGWGSRGLAWRDGRIYTGTQDGRLIALDARTGAVEWSQQTFDKDKAYYLTGAPRIFGDKVVIGNSGTAGAARGYVTAYDATSGKKLWRFYTVPGNPADGFEDEAMAMAAKTWAGEWWKFGGGGHVWNAIAYDPAADTLFLGVGSAYPWNRRVRSRDQGDNLFTASIVALQGSTGKYKWHFQVNPGDAWDYDAAMDIELADLAIDGKPRKVLLTAPKNGFFFVIDRETGKLISAQPYAKVTWASGFDLKTGRPIENPDARYADGKTFDLWPSSIGAHSWPPMAYSPARKLAFIPVIEIGTVVSDAGVDTEHWQPPTDRTVDGAIGGATEGLAGPTSDAGDKPAYPGALVAWDPVAQKAVWKVPYSSPISGGVMATGGDLVFQGTIDGRLHAYSARTGDDLWSFDAKAPLLAAPISYSVDGKQYVTILTGLGGTLGLMGSSLEKYGIDPRSQARRVLTFALGGKATLPPRTPAPAFVEDPDFRPAPASALRGAARFARNCMPCHGYNAVSGTHAPDLRRSSVPLSREAFASVVHDGALVENGMPTFGELTAAELDDLRQYIRSEAANARANGKGAAAAKR